MNLRLIIGASVALALMIPLAFMITSGPTVPTEERVGEEAQSYVAAVVAHLRNSDIRSASQFYRGTLSGLGAQPAEVYAQLLDALVAALDDETTRLGLQLYGEILGDAVRAGVQLDRLLAHERRLRHLALTLAPPDELYRPVAHRLMEFPGLVSLDPRLTGDVIEYYLLFGEDSPQDDRGGSNYQAALDFVPSALVTAQNAERLDQRYFPLRTLARIAAESGLERALRQFQGALARLGDGSEEDLAAFHRWFTRIIDRPDLPRWSPTDDPPVADSTEAPGFAGLDPELAAGMRSWLVGVYRYYSPGRGLDRGSALIRKARERPGGPTSLYRLDEALALREEARRRDHLLRDASLLRGPERVRKLYEIGWNAILLGDAEELGEVISRLGEFSDSIGIEVSAARELLRRAHASLTGGGGAPWPAIDDLLTTLASLLDERERDAWREIADRGELPAADPDDNGRLLLTTGLLWDGLRDDERLQRTLDRLSGELTSWRDLDYLQYLQGVHDYRRGRVQGLLERLFAMLDRPRQPPGLTRSDVGGLAASVERRTHRLESIRERRRAILEDLLPPIIDGLHDYPSLVLFARCIAWLTHMDQTRGRYLETDEGRESLLAIQQRLDTGSDLEFYLEEMWLELQQEILGVSRQLRDAGELERSRAALALGERLIKNRPVYRAEEARLLESMARRIPLAEEERRKEAWLRTAEAYLDAATSDHGDTEYLYDAGVAFLEAGELAPAREALERYPANFMTPGGVGEARRWGQRISLARLAREQGNPRRSAQAMTDGLRMRGAEAHRAEMLIELARAQEAAGEEATALATLDDLLTSLSDSTNVDYLDALYEKARILQRRLGRVQRSARPSEAGVSDAVRAARRAWEELAAKMDANSADPRLAEALYSAAVVWIQEGDTERARTRYLGPLAKLADGARKVDMRPADRRKWHDLAVQGAHALADTHYLEQHYEDALAAYRFAIDLDPAAGNAVMSYFYLGDCAARLQRKREALRLYELGKQRVANLPEEVLQEVPPGRGRDFWIENFDQMIRTVQGT